LKNRSGLGQTAKSNERTGGWSMNRTIPTWRKYRLPRNLNPKSAQLVDSTKNTVYSIQNGQVYEHGVYRRVAESFRDANSCSYNQRISSILRNSSIHYRLHKSPPFVPILSQMNPVHTLPHYFFKTNFRNIFPSIPMTSKLSLYFRLSYQNVTHFSSPRT
jgi:hypothetical protein